MKVLDSENRVLFDSSRQRLVYILSKIIYQFGASWISGGIGSWLIIRGIGQLIKKNQIQKNEEEEERKTTINHLFSTSLFESIILPGGGGLIGIGLLILSVPFLNLIQSSPTVFVTEIKG